MIVKFYERLVNQCEFGFLTRLEYPTESVEECSKLAESDAIDMFTEHTESIRFKIPLTVQPSDQYTKFESVTKILIRKV